MQLSQQALRFQGILRTSWDNDMHDDLGAETILDENPYANPGFQGEMDKLARRFQTELPPAIIADVRTNAVGGAYGPVTTDTATIRVVRNGETVEAREVERVYYDNKPNWFGANSNRGFAGQIFNAARQLATQHCPQFTLKPTSWWSTWRG